jgi:membrane protease YdiL (CAAX protease family)
LVLLQGGGLLLAQIFGIDAEYGEFPDLDSLLAGVTIPVALSVVLLVAVVSYLRWWPRVLHDERRVNRWVWCVPVVMVIASLVMIDYRNLGRIDTSLVIFLALGSLCVGVGEELMFRGISVNVLRDQGMRETRVALWSSLLFGAVHITNIITEGPSAIAQVIVVSVSGFFFYLVLRVSGTLVLGMFIHALWDFSLFSASVGPEGETNPLSFIGIMVNIVLAIVLLVRRHHIGVSNGEPAVVPA